ncbi:uncharacterized protein DFL_001289 [Arthrobotrys flagrans]|uniref:Uncharacterized protein n=1 Tax=Arthrobotrys flagrans TaxID=97331 RepID=A0A437AGM8_ARTFL|nr:hypothetical protein DFL_001289 [Arthrobotrys flagrans]
MRLDGGGLEGVHSVHITHPKEASPQEYISFFRTITPLLFKFLGVKTLRIELFTSFKENHRILNAVFKLLATYPWYDGLKRLVIQWMDYVPSQETLTPQHLEFLYSGSGNGGERRWPKELEEVCVANQVSEGWRFRKEEGGAYNGSFGEGLIAGLGVVVGGVEVEEGGDFGGGDYSE